MAVFSKKEGKGAVYVIVVEFERKFIAVYGRMVDRKWEIEARFVDAKIARSEIHPGHYSSELTEKATKIVLEMAYNPHKKYDESCLHHAFNQMSLALA